MKNILNCVAIDDEPLALELLEDYIQKTPFLELLKSFDSGLEALSFINSNKVDLIFLDIQMPEISGLQLAQIIDPKAHVIFTTAYDQYAVKGFELEATDYLLKPISLERFLKASNKVLKSFNEENDQIISITNKESKPFIFIKTEYRVQKVNLSDILYVEGMKDYLGIKTLENLVLTLMNFKKIEQMLPEGNFIRVHKSYIVAIDKIESIEKNRIKIGEKLIPISDTYKSNFYKKLDI